MKLTTWNVNGIRARLTHVIDFLRDEAPDVLCLQETKVLDDGFPREPLEDEGYNIECFGQKSYNGLAVLSRQPVENVVRNLPDDPSDAERRVLGCNIGDLMLLGLYVPNGQEVGSERYHHKLDWLRRLRAFLDTSYATSEQVALCGDFNVTFDDKDVHDPAAYRERILCSSDERKALRSVLAFGLQDLLRAHHPEGGIWTWWDYQAGMAQKDQGLRIDYVLATPPLAERCTGVVVHKDLRTRKAPSDHVPVSAIFAD
jgi:exodeoxyribonuclease-3